MKFTIKLKGGKGSGHFGHSGRPGKEGGSSAGRGSIRYLTPKELGSEVKTAFDKGVVAKMNVYSGLSNPGITVKFNTSKISEPDAIRKLSDVLEDTLYKIQGDGYIDIDDTFVVFVGRK